MATSDQTQGVATNVATHATYRFPTLRRFE
jgi:hypothetical protein